MKYNQKLQRAYLHSGKSSKCLMIFYLYLRLQLSSNHQKKKNSLFSLSLLGPFLSLPFQTCNETINSASFVFIKNNEAQKLFTPYTTQRCGAGESGFLVWAKGAPKKPGSRNILLFSFNLLAY